MPILCQAKASYIDDSLHGNRLSFRDEAHGNRTSARPGRGQKLQTRYYYNSRQQLIGAEELKVEENSEEKLQQQTQYQYDPLSRRIAKTSQEKQIKSLWDGDVLLQETTGDRQTG